jgi:hypothetical protein
VLNRNPLVDFFNREDFTGTAVSLCGAIETRVLVTERLAPLRV